MTVQMAMYFKFMTWATVMESMMSASYYSQQHVASQMKRGPRGVEYVNTKSLRLSRVQFEI